MHIVHPGKCLSSTCHSVVPSHTSPLMISGDGWWKGFILQCVKFSGRQRVPQALPHLYDRGKRPCCLSLGREDSCASWQQRRGRLRGQLVHGGRSASPVVLPLRPLKIFLYSSELQQTAAAEHPSRPLSEHILITASVHRFKRDSARSGDQLS